MLLNAAQGADLQSRMQKAVSRETSHSGMDSIPPHVTIAALTLLGSK